MKSLIPFHRSGEQDAFEMATGVAFQQRVSSSGYATMAGFLGDFFFLAFVSNKTLPFLSFVWKEEFDWKEEFVWKEEFPANPRSSTCVISIEGVTLSSARCETMFFSNREPKPIRSKSTRSEKMAPRKINRIRRRGVKRRYTLVRLWSERGSSVGKTIVSDAAKALEACQG